MRLGERAGAGRSGLAGRRVGPTAPNIKAHLCVRHQSRSSAAFQQPARAALSPGSDPPTPAPACATPLAALGWISFSQYAARRSASRVGRDQQARGGNGVHAEAARGPGSSIVPRW